MTGGKDFAAFYRTMPTTHIELQAFDAQPVSPDSRGNCGILLTTNGYFRFGDEKNAPQRGFSESFMLVLDPDMGSKYLIGHQSFRLVV